MYDLILRGNAAHRAGLSSPPVKAAETLARVPATVGNRVELLMNGQSTFASIFDGIEAARHYLLVQYYIVRDDALGN